MPVMPRTKLYVSINQGSPATAWLMDFKLEKEHHLGTIGGDEPQNHSAIYVNEDLGVKAGEKVNLTLVHKDILKALKNAIIEDKVRVEDKNKAIG